mmetsp:Transcript_55132/g.91531  ORF Transcript_55132/g.91531 Transcript_55132/m.91531 type:complete len:194 (-) Transcript_55132:46-627(-)
MAFKFLRPSLCIILITMFMVMIPGSCLQPFSGTSCKRIGEVCTDNSDHNWEHCCVENESRPQTQCQGVCCVLTNMHGCAVDEECCDEHAFCGLDGLCKMDINDSVERTAKAHANQPETKIIDAGSMTEASEPDDSAHQSLLQIEISPIMIVCIALALIAMAACCFMYMFGVRKEIKTMNRMRGNINNVDACNV